MNKKQTNKVFNNLLSNQDKVVRLIDASFLSDKLKRNYLQAYQTRLNKLI